MSGDSSVPEPRPAAPVDGSFFARHGFPLAGALVPMLLMAALLVGRGGLVGNDSYYHLRMAAQLPEQGLMRTFPALPYTLLGDSFVNHHLGFQILLSPFARLGALLPGGEEAAGRLFCVLMAGFNGWAVARFLRDRRVRGAWLWLLVWALLPWHYWLRHAYLRAYLPMPGLLVLVMGFWPRGRMLAIGLTVYAAMLIYSNAAVHLLVAGAMGGGAWLSGRPWRTQVRPLAAVLAGVAAGLVLNPYFPENIHFLKVQFWDIAALSPDAVGSEWKPYDAWTLVTQAAPLLALSGAALLGRFARGPRPNEAELSTLLVNLGFLALTCKARRAMEYWPVFALLSTALLASPALAAAAGTRFARLATGGAAALLMAAGALVFAPNRERIRVDGVLPELRRAMAVVRTETRPGDMVMFDDWDLFPYCYALAPDRRYPAGLDPMFCQVSDPWRWRVFTLISRGKIPRVVERGPPAGGSYQVGLDDIHYTLGARVTVVTDDSPALYRALAAHEAFLRVYPPIPVDMEEIGIPVVSVFRRLP